MYSRYTLIVYDGGRTFKELKTKFNISDLVLLEEEDEGRDKTR